MLGLFRRKPHERAAFALYTAAVSAARQPWFYTDLGVADTLDGRFDAIGVHVVLLIARLRSLPSPGPELAQAVFDAMFADMDRTLREIGVGDMTISRKVKQMWEALHGRAAAYLPVLGDPAALATALAHNVWRDTATPGAPTRPAAGRLAAYVQSVATTLAGQGIDRFKAGHITFPPPGSTAEEAAA